MQPGMEMMKGRMEVAWLMVLSVGAVSSFRRAMISLHCCTCFSVCVFAALEATIPFGLGMLPSQKMGCWFETRE